MGTDLAPLVDRIRTLAHEPSGAASARLLERMENTLTDGYAHALAIEGESLRIERAIGAAVADRAEGAETESLPALAERLAETQRELRRLRDELAALRRRTEIVRRSVSRTPA
jgi:vacuolar-type H+-ATPase subunit I/STV1